MKKPEFFKIIHPSLCTTEQLRIPPDFLKHISDEDNGIAVLEGPSATFDWHVRFCKKEGGTYLTEGWKEFVRDNALGKYEFVVFRHRGNMCFHVEIYAKSGCKTLDEYKAKVRNAAMSFTSTRPYFMRCLYPSCVYTSYVLNIPTDFAEAYLPKSKKEIVLQDRSGKSWFVTCNPGRRQYTFCGGWTCFVNENQLNAGDVCVFELIGYMKLRVYIFRVNPTS
ncbi:hypothetical protein AQUCO_00900894v1 [Aquilegia coerulea]|uniref:TF-B3 domain-containing protein n=1 Tax=Aquilegia coerulea TaxID=218851 RepID=A0A2G5EFU8_AQUCA|nr:hypothetical protein AQUCO_00900894v1 [Aquilegia coerulea]